MPPHWKRNRQSYARWKPWQRRAAPYITTCNLGRHRHENRPIAVQYRYRRRGRKSGTYHQHRPSGWRSRSKPVRYAGAGALRRGPRATISALRVLRRVASRLWISWPPNSRTALLCWWARLCPACMPRACFPTRQCWLKRAAGRLFRARCIRIRVRTAWPNPQMRTHAILIAAFRAASSPWAAGASALCSARMPRAKTLRSGKPATPVVIIR